MYVYHTSLIVLNFIKKSDKYFTVDMEELSLMSNTNKDDLMVDTTITTILTTIITTILKLPMKFYKWQVGNIKEYSRGTV